MRYEIIELLIGSTQTAREPGHAPDGGPPSPAVRRQALLPDAGRGAAVHDSHHGQHAEDDQPAARGQRQRRRRRRGERVRPVRPAEIVVTT